MRGEGDSQGVLVVDLDGTLIRSDMLLESFWAGFAQDWRTPFAALAALGRGRAALKARMAAAGAPDPATLPYDPAVLEHLRNWRAAGGRTALVTAANQRLAEAVAAHLGLFDEVHGSNGRDNLKGPAKAAFLNARFGPGGYVYIGDSAADLPVWQSARAALTVGARPALRARVEALHPDATHLSPPTVSLVPALKAMRPHQWLKNLLVLLPLLAAHQFTAPSLAMAALAFLAFGLVASSVYVLNDMLDLDADRAHPRKRFRPLASGALPLAQGMVLAPALLLGGLSLALAVGALFLAVLVFYYLLTLAYSLWLKRRALLDICTLAALYTLRVIAGAAATALAPSVWLLAFSVFFFLSLAAVKRLAELVDADGRGIDGASGRGYRVGDLPLVGQIATGSGFVAVLVMMLYINEPEVLARYSSPILLWFACLVLLYWLTRMVLIASRGQMSDDPVVFATRDRVSQMVIGLIAALFVGATLL